MAPLATTSTALAGKVYVYYGSEAGLDKLVLTGTPLATMAILVWLLRGDGGGRGGDGYDDLVVGAPFGGTVGTETGKAYVFHGRPPAWGRTTRAPDRHR